MVVSLLDIRILSEKIMTLVLRGQLIQVARYLDRSSGSVLGKENPALFLCVSFTLTLLPHHSTSDTRYVGFPQPNNSP